MGSMLTRRAFPFACIVIVLLAVAGCGGSAGPPADVDAAAGSAHFEATAAPEGVTPDLWAELSEELARVLRETSPRAVSTPPAGEAGLTTLSYYEPTSTLNWLYQNSGDYNQDGLVGVSDLTPLGQHFGEESPNGAGQPFPAESLGAAIDGNGDGLIGISDITSIGQSFGVRVEGYRVYTATDENDHPAEPDLVNGPGTTWLADIALSEADVSAGRLRFSREVLPAETELYIWVRPYHGEDDGAASNAVQPSGLNMPPIAVLNAEPTKGLETLTVRFNGLGSGDLDGRIIKYEWDWNGPIDGEEWVDNGSTGVVTHTYDEVGDYLATMRVTDDGGLTATAEVLIKVKTPVYPVARLGGNPLSGAAPLAVYLNAGDSADDDGVIVSWEWAFEQDGGYPYDLGLRSATRVYYYEPGTYTARVRVTDDDGLTSTASVEVNVTAGAQWHDVWVPATGEVRSLSALADIGGLPGMAYNSRTIEPTQYWTMYIRALDALGADWAPPTTIEEVYQVNSNMLLTEVGGRPAAIYNSNYLFAEDGDGSAWPAPAMFEMYGYNKMTGALIDGLPALARGVYFISAQDQAGETWNESVKFFAGYLKDTYAFPSVGAVDGRPAVSFRMGLGEEQSDGTLVYVRARDASGSQWDPPTIVDDSGNTGYHSRLLVVGGHPAITYYDGIVGALRYVRALDDIGSAWGAPLLLEPNAQPLAMFVVDDRPAIFYRDRIDDSLHCQFANDPTGTNWSLPSLITADCKEDSWSFANVAGMPAAAFLDDGMSPRLHYAPYY